MVEPPAQSDEELLNKFQRAAFGYFLEQINPENGLVADTSRAGSPASIAVVGFALSCYPVGVERGWMARADAASRTLVTLRFFCDSAQLPKFTAAERVVQRVIHPGLRCAPPGLQLNAVMDRHGQALRGLAMTG